MAWLHTWSGLVVGWVLFAIFVTGTASYYRVDISRWMRPELSETVADPVAASTRAAAYLSRVMPDAIGWSIRPPNAESSALEVYWWKHPAGPYHHALLDPATGETSSARDTMGGDFPYRFHFELSLPRLWGRWIVGICAMILLISLISGIVTHRRIFADFFTFRRDRTAQRGWLDAHNVVGVLALPFHLMIVYTGLIELGPMLMPWSVKAAYSDDIMGYYTESGLMAAHRTPTGKPGTLRPLGDIMARAIADGGEAPEVLMVTMPGDAAASVTAYFEERPGLAHLHPQIVYAGDTGAEVSRTGDVGPATGTGAVMIGLHEAHFAGGPLRVLFFLCGVMGAATVASGLVLWTVARAPTGANPAGLGLRIVGALNVGTIAGLPTGLAAYFLANRVLPLDLAGRADWEVRVFFAAWILAAVAASLYPAVKAWPIALGVAALTFLAIPALDLILVSQARFLGFDAAMLAVAVLLGTGARLAAKRPERLRAAKPALSRTVEA